MQDNQKNTEKIRCHDSVLSYFGKFPVWVREQRFGRS